MKQLLLIDSELSSMNLSKRFLENHGYKVFACSSADKAMELMLDPKLDLIISEIDFPGLNGFDLCTILTRFEIKVPLIFLSNRDDEATKLEAYYAGVKGFISKQSEYALLPKKVSEILTKNSFIKA